jgi:TP901 family phage tail tape measure protein
MANEVEIPISLDNKELIKSIQNIEKNMGDLTKKMQSQFEQATKSVGNSFDKLGNNIASSFAVGTVVGNLATKAIDYLGATIKGAVTEAVNFNRALVEIETILPKGTSLTAQMVKQLEDLSTQFGTTPTSQAKAYYEIISAGVEDTADATDLLVNANKLATGGLADITGVIDTLTTVYNVYGREVGNAQEASDSLFKTVQLGKTTMSELQNDIGRVLPIAKTFGLSLDEVGSAMVLLTNSGLKTREAVSYLTALLVGISRNGKELGSTMNSSAIQTDGFATVMQRLIDRSKGSNDALIKLVGSSEAVRAIQALNAQGLSKYNDTLAQYADKAGVAGEASKKIIEKDLSKQFDILSQNIGRVARDFVNIFTPAVSGAVVAINKLFTTDVSGDVEKKIDNVRLRINQLERDFKLGTVPLVDYQIQMKRLKETLTDLSNASENATSPMISQVRILQEESKRIQAQINSLKLGFDGVKALGPLEAQIKAGQLEEKLKGVNAQILALTNKKPTADVIPPTVIMDEQTKTYGTLEADTKTLHSNLLAEQANYDSQVAIMREQNAFTRREMELQATYDLEMAKLQATASAELDKTKFIKDEEEKRLTQQKIYADTALKSQSAYNKLAIAQEKEKENQRKLVQKGALEITGNFIQAGLALAKEGSDLQKGLLIAEAIRNTYAGATRAFSDYPFPLSAGVAGSVIALGLANVAKITGAKFENGGIVGGNSYSGDRVPVRVNSGEMILNRNQQTELFNMANGDKAGSNSLEMIRQIVAELRNTPIIVQANGRELARLVRDESRSGFSFS